ncbi:Alpha/Beta hydrolase protein [Daldinia caldariorum]|uniref:Alpha/Beta hydrolase protein n=1 Tax=Daldinia caldariorum TaxID=326644 RepID=UPI0020078E47|nr:Alpha/Beta hydrolase protein [Daldinia caldariorum]KAI1469114.1 Alpha/Beta hydrolase protein [Daldinia caldariorum]
MSTEVKHNLKYHPEFGAFWEKLVAAGAAAGPAEPSLEELRESNDTFMRTMFAQFEPVPSVVRTKYTTKSYDGAEIDVYRYATEEHNSSKTPLPAVLHIHGGGMMGGSVDIFARYINNLVDRTGIQFFAVEYRLVPEHPDPTPVEDSYAAVKWIHEHAAEFNVDTARLGVMGDSAGAGLSAGVSLLARDRGLQPPIKKQILVYPMLDDRTIFAYDAPDYKSPLKDLVILHTNTLIRCWRWLLGDKAGKPDADVSIYAAPARAKDLSGLPAAYIEVGNLDWFRDESIDYAKRLSDAHTEVELHIHPGMPHGFEVAGPISTAKKAVELRVDAIKALAH